MFEVHLLNDEGIQRAKQLQHEFERMLSVVEDIVEVDPDKSFGHRELAIVRTKLQEASFFAKRAMAMQPQHQER